MRSERARGDPFPADGLIPILFPLADYGWAVGFASALLIYRLLSLLFPQKKQPNLVGGTGPGQSRMITQGPFVVRMEPVGGVRLGL